MSVGKFPLGIIGGGTLSALGRAGTTPTPPAVTALLAPATTAMGAKVKIAFGFDRLVESFASNTVNLKRLSDNATQDFGFDANGYFNTAAVDSWRSGADVDVVKFYDQKGALVFTGNGTCALVRSNVWGRFGTTFSESTAALTRSTTEGGVGVNLASIGHFTVANTGLSLSTGNLEFHVLFSPNNRKKGSTDATDPVPGATTTGEEVVTYGFSNNARFYYRLAGAAAPGTSRIQTSAVNLVNANWSPQSSGSVYRWKQYGQQVASLIATTTGPYGCSMYGQRVNSGAYVAGLVTDIAAGGLDNGTLCVGALFSGTGTFSTSGRFDGLFGGIIVTSGLTDYERCVTLQCRLSLVGQQHLNETEANILAMYDRWIFLRDVNAGTGAASWLDSVSSMAFNVGVGNTWDFAYTVPDFGVTGIRSPTANASNTFADANAFFAGVTTGEILSFHFSEETLNTLQYAAVLAPPASDGTNGTTWSLTIGNDHGGPSMWNKQSATARDQDTLSSNRRKADDTEWGTAIYEAGGGGANQPEGKYARNGIAAQSGATGIFMKYDEVIPDGTLTQAWWQGGTPGVGGAPAYSLDAPVYPHSIDNTQSPLRQLTPLLLMGSFTSPVGYSRSNSYASRKAQRLQGVARMMISAGLSSVPGHLDATRMYNPYAGVVDSDDTAIFRSGGAYQQPYKGVRIGFAVKNGNLTERQKEKVAANAFKLRWAQ